MELISFVVFLLIYLSRSRLIIIIMETNHLKCLYICFTEIIKYMNKMQYVFTCIILQDLNI